MRKIMYMVLVSLIIVGIFGCASMKKSEKGAIIGATAGAIVGGIIGKAAGSTAAGAILGAGIGGMAGAYIGNYMDEQAAEMERDLEGAKIERIGEGIKITFDSGILFQVNKAALQPEAKTNLENLAVILQKYADTEILIEGHTDSTGSEEYNMDLSIKRANSVGIYLANYQVSSARFKLLGYGEIQPLESNVTADGRKQNRRVEIAIFANEKLKKVAKNKTGDS